MDEKITAVITEQDLSRYCAELRLMLSWGLPLTRLLREMENQVENPFLKYINIHIQDHIMTGNTLHSFYEKFPTVFKPLFTRWIELGEKYGILDEVCGILAGILRFDDLLSHKDSPVPRTELGKFLAALAEKIATTGETPAELLKKQGHTWTNNSTLRELIENTNENNENKLFSNSTTLYLNSPLHRKIAPPLTWAILNYAEEGEYLPTILTILGEYLKDPKQILPENTPVSIDVRLPDENYPAYNLAKTILKKTAKSTETEITLIEENKNYTVSFEGNTITLNSFLEIPPDNSTAPKGAFLGLISILEFDMAEKRLRQKTEIPITIDNTKYRAHADLTPPFPMKGKKVTPEDLTGPQQPVKLTIRLMKDNTQKNKIINQEKNIRFKKNSAHNENYSTTERKGEHENR